MQFDLMHEQSLFEPPEVQQPPKRKEQTLRSRILGLDGSKFYTIEDMMRKTGWASRSSVARIISDLRIEGRIIAVRPKRSRVAFYKVCEQRIEVPERVFEQPTEVPEPSIYRNSDKVMDAIRYGGPVTAAEIVEMTGVGLSSVSTTLTKLWKEGRIDRIRVNGRYEHQLSADEDTEPQQEACVIEPIETNDSQNKPLPFNPPDSAKLELEVGGDPMLLPISAWRQLYGELCRMFG